MAEFGADRDHLVTLGDGRIVSYAEWGQPDGRPVVFVNGCPGSRLMCPDVEETLAAGVRLLTIDRPGYGWSSPLPGRKVVDWVADFVEWADLIGLPPCPVVGWSVGGQFALALSASCPARVTSVGVAAGHAPLDELHDGWNSLSDETRAYVESLRRDPIAGVEATRVRCGWFEDWESVFEPNWATDGAQPESVNPDDQLKEHDEILQPLREQVREAARQGTAGVVADSIASWLPWGFSLSEVALPVHLWWGDGDALVPRADTECLSDRIQGSTLTILAGEGHLFPVTHWREMLAALA